jgi:L-aspartate oxidase
VSPAAHYVMGGVETDLDGRTSVPSLFAAGEVACTGVHGANRLASNSLLEGLVFGLRAGRAMRDPRLRTTPGSGISSAVAASAEASGETSAVPASDATPASDAGWTTERVRELMWRSVGIFRDGPGLRDAVCQLDAGWRWLRTQPAPGTAGEARLASVLTVARLMARAALRREESRGAHFRADFPERDDARWRHHVADVF